MILEQVLNALHEVSNQQDSRNTLLFVYFILNWEMNNCSLEMIDAT